MVGNKKQWVRSTPLAMGHSRPGLLLMGGERGIWLAGCDGKPRCRFDNLKSPTQLELLSGELLRPDPHIDQSRLVSYRRLPNGHIFYATDRRFCEISWDKEVVYSHDFAKPIASARFLADGQLLCIARGGRSVFKLQLRTNRITYTLPWKLTKDAPIWATALRDHFLVCFPLADEPVEIDNSGKVMCRFSLKNCRSLEPLPGNGSFLAVCCDREVARVLEVDRTNRVLWDAPSDGLSLYVHSCLNLVRIGFTNPRPVGVDLESAPYLAKFLADKDTDQKRWAASHLAALGTKAAPACSALVTVLADADEETCDLTTVAIERIGPQGIGALIAGLADNRAEIRARIIQILGTENFRSEKRVVSPLVNALGDPDPNVRGNAADALRWFGAADPAVVAALIRVARENNPAVRRSAISSLGFFAGAAENVVPVLIESLKDRNAEIVAEAAEGLGRIGPGAKRSVPALLELVKGKDRSQRCAAINALGGIGRHAKEAVPLLLSVLQDDTYKDCRSETICSLGNMRDASASAVPVLVKFLSSKELRLRGCAVVALGRIGPKAKEAVPGLITVLQDRASSDLQEDAAEALRAIGPAASAAVPALQLLAKGTGVEAEAAARALRKIIAR